jgi:hypothetical protein
MSKLSPCPTCQRHIRLTSTVCPFCDAAITSTVLSDAHAARRVAVPKGVKRAVLFAIGAGLTSAACADGEDEGDTDTTELAVPVYGAPFDTTDPTTVGTSSDATTTWDSSDDSDTTDLAQPEYGAPVFTSDTETTDTDAPTFTPVYGAPISPDASVGTDGSDTTGSDITGSDITGSDITGSDTAGADAGATDAGASADAGEGDAGVDNSSATRTSDDSEGLAFPVYGASPALKD